MQLEFEKEVYNLYLDYMGIEDNNISYKMFIWDVLYKQIINSYKHIDEFNITYWEDYDLKFYGIRHKIDSYQYWFYKIDKKEIETHHYFASCLIKLKNFILNINIEELDLTKCNKGDRLLLRNGEIVIFEGTDYNTDTLYIIDGYSEECPSAKYNFKKNGIYHYDPDSELNVIKIL